MTNYLFGDMKYYYQIHCARQRMLGNKPVCYERFVRRLKIMNLHDAIYTPRSEGKVRDMKTLRESPIQDNIRRTATLNDENIQILDFKHLEMVEQSFKKRKKNETKIPKPKKSLWDRFISFFKRGTPMT